MIEKIKAWIRHLLGWKTPTEVIMDMNLGKTMREAMEAGACDELERVSKALEIYMGACEHERKKAEDNDG